MGPGVLNAAAVGLDFEPGFSSSSGELLCDTVRATDIADAVGTPAYVYSAGVVRRQYRRLDAALRGVPHRLHYSVKANSSLAILRLLQAEGSGVDIVSGGELYRAHEAGFSGRDIVFSGVGKTARELDEALAAGVLFVNVESEGELVVLDEVARARGVVAPVALRVNPEVLVDSPHHYIRTGERGHKFGIPYDDVRDAARLTRSLPNVELVGLDMHLGSQLASFEPYGQALERVLALVAQLRADDFRLRYLDIGGGLGVVYRDEPPADVARFADGVAQAAAGLDLSLILEPGRFLVAEAGILLTRVLYRKRSGGKEYIVTDAGMNDLVRPSHYDAYHEITAVRPREARIVADVVGPVCESGDFLALNRVVDDVRPGDVLAIHTAGAYGFAMASNYNSRPRPAEVLVDGDRYAIVTERERYEDLVRQERAALGVEDGVKIGLLADTHDRLPAIAELLGRFQRAGVTMVLHAGDFCAPFAMRPFAEARLPLVGVFGRNDGDREGLIAAASALPAGGELFESPHSVDIGGRTILVVHDISDVLARSLDSHAFVIHGCSHQTEMKTRGDTLLLNPGEGCGWLSGAPTGAVLDLEARSVEVIKLTDYPSHS